MSAESDYLRGGCYALAAWLHLKTDLPIYGLFDDDGLMHHAMVGDHDGQTLYDARGRISPEWAFMIRGRRCMGTNLREATLQDLRDMHELNTALGGFNPTERQIRSSTSQGRPRSCENSLKPGLWRRRLRACEGGPNDIGRG